MKRNSTKIKVEYIRDGLIEESHEGIFVTNQNSLITNEHESNELFYIRSCAKPLQATMLIDYGIELTPEQLALCCGSHAGENCHIKIAQSILKEFGLEEHDLKCGIHKPLSESMQKSMLLKNEQANQLHNNCSGKHIAFLAICKKKGWDIKTYDDPNHPLQIAIKEKIYSLCGIKNEYPVTTDGCGVPILSMPLINLANGYVKLLKYPQIINAIKKNPYIFGGENRTDTEIIQNTQNIIAKVGAGGLCTVLNTKNNNSFALKINDASYYARRIAVFELINKLGWGKIDYDNTIKTIAGKTVGHISVSLY